MNHHAGPQLCHAALQRLAVVYGTAWINAPLAAPFFRIVAAAAVICLFTERLAVANNELASG